MIGLFSLVEKRSVSAQIFLLVWLNVSIIFDCTLKVQCSTRNMRNPKQIPLNCSVVCVSVSVRALRKTKKRKKHWCLLQSSKIMYRWNRAYAHTLCKSWHFVPGAAFDPCVVNLLPLSFILTFHFSVPSQFNDFRDGQDRGITRRHLLTVHKQRLLIWKQPSGVSAVINTHWTAHTVALRHVNWLQQIVLSV